MVICIIAAACSLVGAICGALCLWRLMRWPGEENRGFTVAEEDKESAQLRENLINLMEYRVGSSKEEDGQ